MLCFLAHSVLLLYSFNFNCIALDWFVIYTKPQQEKKVAQGLESLGIEVFCPLVTEVKQWSDRKKKVTVPLIKSYVFVKIEESKRNAVFEIPGVVRYLFWLGKPAIVRDVEITALRDSLSKPYTEVKVVPYTVGTKIKIPEGPFQNSEGTVVKISAKYITVALEQLGMVVSISY